MSLPVSWSRPLALLAGLAFSTALAAAEVGWRTMTVPAVAERAAIPLALWYPAADGAVARTVAMGPFSVRAAVGAGAAAGVRGLIVVSHGTGGTELGHGRLAEALAAHGYLVAALRHPGDHWQDDSLRTRRSERYFDERPAHVSQVIDALLADPAWGPRIARDAGGPRIGVVGHSAGGFTAVALAGGRADAGRIAAHCRERAAEDPIFCALPRGSSSTAPPAAASRRDARVRAVAVLSPLGVVFDAASLREVRVPVTVWVAERDRFLVPRFHGEWLADQVPGAGLRRVPGAAHFAFMDTPAMPIASPDGDIASDPPGFDRAAFLATLGPALAAYFDAAIGDASASTACCTAR